MHVTAAVVIGLISAAAMFLAARGIGALVRRKWKAGIVQMLGCAGVFTLAMVVLTTCAYALGPAVLDGHRIDPSQKARILAENIATLMNISGWGLPLGLLAGALAALRDRRL